MIGRVVKGKYKIYDEVGSGGFATVYLGLNMDTNEIVAIKVLNQQYTRDSRYVERFRREAGLAERLQHPNIVRVLDHGIEEGLHFLVMEFVEGLTLNEVIARKGRLSLEEAVSYTEQVCAGLQAAHQAGVVHRDIKPANLMITPGGAVKIMDFGIARMESQAGLTQSGVFMGTPRYISPEMARGSEADIRSDLYAVGLVLYEMLSGRPAFDGENPWSVLRQQIESDPPPIGQVRHDVPPWLEAVIFRAVAKDPARRFQTPAEMLAVLQMRGTLPTGAPTAVASLPAAEATFVAPAVKARRAPTGLIIGLAGAAALVAVALIILLLSRGGGPASPTPVATTQVVVLAPTATPTALPTTTPFVIVVTSTPIDTETPSPTPPPTDTPLPTDTATPQPTGLPAEQPTDTPPPASTATPEPTATATPRPTPGGSTRPTAPGPITGFEQFGAWKRGDQPNGTFVQSAEQVHSGSYAGKLTYDLPSAGNDFVVFLQTYRLGGRPNQIGAWVYGDGRKHYLNVWVRDAAGETWQFSLGQVKHTGWQQMVAWLDPAAPWPAGHIDGPSNGAIDYPIDFRGLTLDDVPDSFSGSGVIYIDDLYCAEAEVPLPGATPAPTGQAGPPQPTGAAQPPAISGRIAFSAGGLLHIVQAATGQDTVAPIPSMRQPDFRADGQLIIANGEGGGRDSLWTIDARTGGFVREQSPFTNDFRPFWSPDGTQIVYDSLHQGKGHYNLYKNVLDSKRDNFLLVESMAVIGTSPVWMHDDWIAFTGCDYWPGGTGGSRCGIYRMPSWGGRPALVKPGNLTMRATDNHGPHLLFMSQESGDWEVYLIPNQGGAERNLSNSPTSQDGLGTFSPDGRLVAFVSNRGGGWAVWVVAPDGSGLTKLFNLPAPLTGTWTEEHISWGP